MSKILKRIAYAAAALIVIMPAVFVLWSELGGYEPEAKALACFSGTDSVKVTEESYGYFFDGKGESDALVFYPGAFVDCESYAPQLLSIAEKGIDCFLVRMPHNFAIAGMNRVERIIAGDYDYDNWYIGGHSLGGATASMYLNKHPESFDGIIFMASYPAKDIDIDGISSLSISGGEDGVLSWEKYEQGFDLLPEDAQAVIIPGGCHAWFGAYGQQKGDGTAAITQEEQWEQTAEAVSAFIIK